MFRLRQQRNGPRERCRGVVIDIDESNAKTKRLPADGLGVHGDPPGVGQCDLQFQQRRGRLFVNEADQAATLVEVVNQDPRARRANVMAFEWPGDANVAPCRSIVFGLFSHFGDAVSAGGGAFSIGSTAANG